MPAPCDAIAASGRAVLPAVRGAMVAAFGIMLAACNTVATYDTAPKIPFDYRQRHPISITEGDRQIELFVGAGRGGLTPVQRAQVTAFAGSWKRDATGGITIDRPMGGPNERAATHSLNETLSILASAGVPHQGVRVRPYQARPDKLANLRLGFPQIVATAGPCGLWPDDLGPTYQRSHFENQPYWNLGCASQRNLASMVENPADLVQPRAETPAYTAKRNVALDKWRRGESPHTHYPDPNKGAVSELSK